MELMTELWHAVDEYLPGHWWLLQETDSKEYPAQFPPPQTLCLICVPPPQVLSQEENFPQLPHTPEEKNTDYISCKCINGCLSEETQKYASNMVLGCVIFPINAIFVGKTGLKHISVTHCKIKIINNILNLLCDFTSKYVYNVITDRVLLQIFYLK